MRALQLVAPGTAALGEKANPTAAADEVVLRVTGAGLCHSDLNILANPSIPYPDNMVLGHEIAGTIVELGANTSGWKVGDSALVHPCWSCQKCDSCLQGELNYCQNNSRGSIPGPGLGADGGMAEFVSVPVNSLVPLGDLDPVAAAPLVDAALTPYHAIASATGRLQGNATAVVIGIGGLGHVAVQILKAVSSARIIAVDNDTVRLSAAKGYGADVAIISDTSAAELILQETGGRGADAVFDFVGIDATLALAAACIATRGSIVQVGLGRGQLPFKAVPPPNGLPWGTSLFHSYGGTMQDLREVVNLAAQGKIAISIDQRPLEEAERALDDLKHGRINGRCVLVP